MKEPRGAGLATREPGPGALGPELERLVAGVGTPLRRAVTLTRLRGPGVAHASFRLEFADGGVLKGRRLGSAADAARVTAILDVMDRRHFPPVVARAGAAFLEEWRPGLPLHSTAPDPALFRRAGGMLGAVHRVPPPPGVAAHPWATPADRLAALESQAGALARQGALSTAAWARAIALARDRAPRHAAIGVIHRDFCAENLVQDPTGRLHVIDNETMHVGALDLDLARVWYRWPMTGREATALLGGYAAHRSPAAFLAHFPFWTLAVVVDAAAFHARAGSPRAPAALARLRRFLDEPAATGGWTPEVP